MKSIDMFKGAITALITPFTEDGVDFDAYKQFIEFQIEQGIKGVLTCGSTGEAATMSVDEHKRTIETAVSCVDGRIPVIAGAGANNTKEAIELTQFAKSIGVDAVLSVVPYYNKPTQAGLIRHFSIIAEQVNLPIILYNVPSRTGTNMQPETVAKLAQIPSIIGLKDAAGDIRQTSDTLAVVGPDFLIFSGDDSMTLPMMSIGVQGLISVTSNVVPHLVQQMVSAGLNNQIEEARALHFQLEPLNKILFIETNPIPVKEAVAFRHNYIHPRTRLPLLPLTEHAKQALMNVLHNYF
jgi:4-hydroxy-tetrahydrodipicolinate synthase